MVAVAPTSRRQFFYAQQTTKMPARRRRYKSPCPFIGQTSLVWQVGFVAKSWELAPAEKF
jgi:hypothetical protein